MWSGVSVPANWALCNGATVNGIPTPDLRNRFIVGASYNPSESYLIGATGGTNGVTLTLNQIPSHNHGGTTGDDSPDHFHRVHNVRKSVPSSPTQQPIFDYDVINYSNPSAPATGGANQRHQHPISSSGGGQAHENRPPYYALAFIMRVQ